MLKRTAQSEDFLKELNIAIVHPYFISRGGGEKVIDAIADILPHAHIFTLMADKSAYSQAIADKPVHATWLNRIPRHARIYQYLSPFFDQAIRTHDLSKFDLIISSGGPGAKTCRVPDHAVHVHYCHTPVRYLWDQFETWRARLPTFLRPVFSWSVKAQRHRDLKGVESIDFIIANSDFVGSRIETYYNRSSTTIYPPVDLAAVEPTDATGDYYLSVGRLVPNKRTDLLIEACNQSGRELIIVGEGPEKEYLSKIAGPTVSLTGRVSSARLADLFSKARAYLFAAEEDFGIATAEAQSYGLPVIAYKQGGTAEIISNDELGVLFEDQTIDSVDGALSKFEAREHKFDRKLIQEHARKFGKERFVSEMRDFLQRCTSSQSDKP